MSSDFSQAVLNWFDEHGRHDLPWQQNKTPYRVWVSEIMLQQTQVVTVIDYYQRFMQRFPDVQSLAAAEQDEVLHYWTGLGYYARARNLHKCAQTVVEEFKGEFPQTVEGLESLSGIGRSTAGAIASISMGKHASILDGNVKRVLSRFHGVEGWPGNKKVADEMWLIAERYTPAKRTGEYTQAMMDLGATLCTRSKPQCQICPLQAQCEAYALDRVKEFPFSKPKKEKPIKSTRMLMLEWDGRILLKQQPSSGIWGGLWIFPMMEVAQPMMEHELLNHKIQSIHEGDVFRHTFSHYHLDIHPVHIKLAKPMDMIGESKQLWYNLKQPDSVGLAAPVKKLLESLNNGESLS
jgi:A/G-specific adenine glycosylase